MYIENKKKLEDAWSIESRPIAAVPWTDWKNSSPIEDMRSWQKSIGNICGIFGNVIEFNYDIFDLIKMSEEHLRLGFEPICYISDISNLLWSECKIEFNSILEYGIVIVKSEGEYLPEWYSDLEANVCP